MRIAGTSVTAVPHAGTAEASRHRTVGPMAPVEDAACDGAKGQDHGVEWCAKLVDTQSVQCGLAYSRSHWAAVCVVRRAWACTTRMLLEGTVSVSVELIHANECTGYRHNAHPR